MAAKKKRMTQKEKDLNRAWKKEMQEKGILPPDKKRLNRRKFIKEASDEWNKKDPDCYIWDFYLMNAVSYMMGQIDKRANPSSEAVGVAKVLKVAMKARGLYAYRGIRVYQGSPQNVGGVLCEKE